MKTRKVSVNDETFALLIAADEVKEGSEWFGSQFEPLQASRMKYEAGKNFAIHRHIMNPRTINVTQEAFIVIKGKLAVDVYDKKNSFLGTLEADPGEAILVYRGGHGVRVVETGVFFEIKAGQFNGILSEEKVFINPDDF